MGDNRFSKLTLLGLAVLLSPTCSKVGSSSAVSDVDTESIIESDMRITVDPSDPIYKTVGGIGDASAPYCTAFKIEGNKFVTARHCVVDKQGNTMDRLRFYLMNSATSYPVSSFINLYQNADIAYFSVDSYSVPDMLELANSSSASKNLLVYSAQVTAGSDSTYSMEIVEESGCVALGQDPDSGLMLHSCSTVPGSSGSPILVDGKVVGIHLGAMNDNYKNPSAPVEEVNVACTLDQLNTTNVTVVPYNKECGCSWRCPGSCHPNLPPFIPPIIPPVVHIPSVPTLDIHPVHYDVNSNTVAQFMTCALLPNKDEAAQCLGMIVGCFPAVAATHVGYAVCIIAACGTASVETLNRCADEEIRTHS